MLHYRGAMSHKVSSKLCMHRRHFNADCVISKEVAEPAPRLRATATATARSRTCCPSA